MNKFLFLFFFSTHRPPPRKRVDRFTQIVQDEACALGCAMIKYNNYDKYTYYFVCNYSLNNIIGECVYESSTEAASKCKTGKNPDYPGLCSVNELNDR